MDTQRAAELVQGVVQRRFRQGQRVQPGDSLGVIRRDERHRPGAAVSVLLEKLFRQRLRLVALERIADDQRAAPGVVTDPRLQVSAVHPGRDQREGNPGVQQGDGGPPISTKLSGGPAVGFRPGAFLMVEGAAVPDFPRDGSLIRRAVPEMAQRGERRGRAGFFVLADERHRQGHAPGGLPLGVTQAFGGFRVKETGRREGVRRRRCPGQIVEQQTRFAPARGEPLAARVFQ